jgi:hypothetical protein
VFEKVPLLCIPCSQNLSLMDFINTDGGSFMFETLNVLHFLGIEKPEFHRPH